MRNMLLYVSSALFPNDYMQVAPLTAEFRGKRGYWRVFLIANATISKKRFSGQAQEGFISLM
jgi:hypothetical protein